MCSPAGLPLLAPARAHQTAPSCASASSGPQVKKDNPEAKLGEIAKIIGEKWGKLSDKEKEPYQKKAEADKVRRRAGAAVGRHTPCACLRTACAALRLLCSPSISLPARGLARRQSVLVACDSQTVPADLCRAPAPPAITH